MAHDPHTPVGHIRCVNLRGDGILIDDDEAPFRVDRSNPTLGNPFHLSRRGDAQARAQVLAKYQQHLDQDLSIGGPISQVVHELAIRINAGENIALQCWCAPLPCHGQSIAAAVKDAAQVLRSTPLTQPMIKPINRPKN